MNEVKEQKHPLFSLVVPAYNSESFIDRCIVSALNQSFGDFELILVDDGSFDKTFQICKKYEEEDLRVKVIHKENGGHTSARNEGLKASSGEYILFLDSDDWLDISALEICKHEISKNYPDIVIFGMVNTATENEFPIYIDDGFYNTDNATETIWNKLMLDPNGRVIFPASLSAKCFKRNIIIKNQLSVPSEVLIGEDGAAFVGAMLGSKSVSIVSNTHYNCFVRQGSVSHSSDHKAFSRLPFLFEYYRETLGKSKFDLQSQFERFIVAQIYTALLFVLRSGGGAREINSEIDQLLQIDYVRSALKRAKFNIKGYKYIIKKTIIRCHLWELAKLLDR